MDNPEQFPQQPTFQPELPSAPVKKRKASIVIWILLIIFLVISIASSALYIVSRQKLNDAEQLRATIQQKLNTNELSLKDAQEKLKTASFLPSKDQMSPQCYSGNNDQTKLAQVNPTPIDNYNVYIVNCVNDLVEGKDNSKVIAFEVDKDGNQKFVYGAGSGEPYCISGKILPATAAFNISEQTGIPVCKTF